MQAWEEHQALHQAACQPVVRRHWAAQQEVHLPVARRQLAVEVHPLHQEQELSIAAVVLTTPDQDRLSTEVHHPVLRVEQSILIQEFTTAEAAAQPHRHPEAVAMFTKEVRRAEAIPTQRHPEAALLREIHTARHPEAHRAAVLTQRQAEVPAQAPAALHLSAPLHRAPAEAPVLSVEAAAVEAAAVEVAVAAVVDVVK